MFASSRAPATVSLEELAQACRSGRVDLFSKPFVQATGWPFIDQVLPGEGLPVGAVTEIMSHADGIGELSIVIPALARITHEDRYVAFVEPPYIPYPLALVQQGIKLERVITISGPALASSLWASEQMLRCSAFGAVLTWPAVIDDKEVRRLQLAAEAGGNLAILYRPVSAARYSSPAAVRLLVSANGEGVRVEVKKCRGGRAGSVARGHFSSPPQAA
jgi:hypothetical protein